MKNDEIREGTIRYRCLILDHDDTVVKSTPEIHYPSFVEAMRVLRPDIVPISLEEFVSYCFHPGFLGLCRDIMKFDDQEELQQYQIWKSFMQERSPDFYEGFPQFLIEYKEAGGLVCVVTHSESEHVIRDYVKNCNFVPDMIFGWELAEAQRKPNPYPILEIMKSFNLRSEEILVVDDLKPGLDMAKNCNVAFAAAGWSHIIPEIKDYMEQNSDYYFLSVVELKEYVMNYSSSSTGVCI